MMLRYSPRAVYRGEPAPAEPVAPTGALTGIALDDVHSLCLPRRRDAFDRLRPPFSRDALRLSLELAQMTYQLNIEPWTAAGWRDVSIQIDNQLESGLTVGESESVGSERVAALLSAHKLKRARSALRENNPLAQLLGAVRQRKGSDTIKAVTMLHKTPGGRYVVGVGFMGTGTRFYDWFSNFRFTAEGGFHKGFKQLTNYFEQSAERIAFPETAEELGLERLTLADILTEMKRADSRFSLWMAGHSQGGAVMQVFCHSLLYDWRVQPSLIVGYGFASPTVATRKHPRDPAGYPLYHVINADDFVPRMGAEIHLGQCLMYQPSDAFRQSLYGWRPTPEGDALRREIVALTSHCADTTQIMETVVAFLYAFLEARGDDALDDLLRRRWVAALASRVLQWAGKDVRAIADKLALIFDLGYRSLTGSPMDRAAVDALKTAMLPSLQAHTMGDFFAGLNEVCYAPHHITRAHAMQTGAYAAIVNEHAHELRAFVWRTRGEQPATRRWAKQSARPARRADRAGTRTPARRSARDRAISGRRSAGAKKRAVPSRD